MQIERQTIERLKQGLAIIWKGFSKVGSIQSGSYTAWDCMGRISSICKNVKIKHSGYGIQSQCDVVIKRV